MPKEPVYIYTVEVISSQFARVHYTAGISSYIVKVELTKYNQVTVTPPPAAFPKDQDPIEFSDDDLKAILQLMLRKSVKFIVSALLENNGVIQRVFTLKTEQSG